MSTASLANPPADGWVAAIHASERDHRPLGSAIVIDNRRILTAAHLVTRGDAVIDPLWVSFPKAATKAARHEKRKVVKVDLSPHSPHDDVAVLTLREAVPAGVELAPLRCPQPSDLVGKRWWAFGFPDQELAGNAADGSVDAALAVGWIRLETTSRYRLATGFSGAGLWSSDYQAVVGLLVHDHRNGDGRAITLHEVVQCLPDHDLAPLGRWSPRVAGDVGLAAWGWSLAKDPEGSRHWQPRARGVSSDSERGYRFRGRTKVLTEIVAWLDRAVPDRRILVVTGSPGVGKSAVLGRVVTTSDPEIRALLPADDDDVKASVNAVACAVHAKGKSALDVAKEIARAASARLPEQPSDLAAAIRAVLEEHPGSRFNVIIDALDEAASTVQTRAIISGVAIPLVQDCADLGVRVIIGTRRYDDEGFLLGSLQRTLVPIDLDAEEYFDQDDLESYALACLQMAGNERSDNPYQYLGAAEPVARRIAVLADRNFLVAGLIARDHGMHDDQPADLSDLGFDATIELAVAEYLNRVSPVAGLPAKQILTALAFAEAPGLSAELWQAAIESLYGVRIPIAELVGFTRSTAANYLVESTGALPDESAFRLFHQALNDVLVRARSEVSDRREDEAQLTRAFIGIGRQTEWKKAHQYLLRSLPGHAGSAGLIDELLADDAFLLYADLPRLMLAADETATPEGRLCVQMIGQTPQASLATDRERAALFSVTQALEHMPISFGDVDSSYVARWASAQPRGGLTLLEAHQGRVNGLCSVVVDGRQLLATASDDRTVRIWDPATGQQIKTLEGHSGAVLGVCAVAVGTRQLLATTGDDRSIRIWDLATAQQVNVLEGHRGAILGVCAVIVGTRQLLATTGYDRTARIWDPATGQQINVLEGHTGAVLSLCAITVGTRELLATASYDQTVRIWDPATGQLVKVLADHAAAVSAICPLVIRDRHLLATACADGTVRIWDAASGEQIFALRGHPSGITGLCWLAIAGQQLLATSGYDRTVRIWDLATGRQTNVLQGHQGAISAVCRVGVAKRQLLASASDDRTVQIWEPTAAQQSLGLTGHRDWVNGLCAVVVENRRMLATASDDRTVRIWDPANGHQVSVLDGHRGPVLGVCPVVIGSRNLLASASDDRTVRIWDPASGQHIGVFEGH
jgi:WD40 repeat protein